MAVAVVGKGKPDTFTIGRHTIRCLHKTRVLLIDDKHEIKLSPTEYRILMLLLDGRPIDDYQLASILFGTEDDLWTHDAVDKHMDNIRKKFKRNHLSLYIHRLVEYGYVLAPKQVERVTSQKKKVEVA